VRLDKYLKEARVVKRRTVAKLLCDAGKVYVEGKVAKAGVELRGGEVVEVVYAGKRIRLLVGPPGGPLYLSREEERIPCASDQPVHNSLSNTRKGNSLFDFDEHGAGTRE